MLHLPLFLLVGTALHHRWRMLRLGQSSWKGGGFAMFSDLANTMDVTELCGYDDEGPFNCLPLVTERDPNMTRLKARTIPVVRHVDAWAREVSSGDWERNEGFLRPWRQSADRARVTVTGVRVRILVLDFNAWTGVYTASQRYCHSLQCAQPGPEHDR